MLLFYSAWKQLPENQASLDLKNQEKEIRQNKKAWFS